MIPSQWACPTAYPEARALSPGPGGTGSRTGPPDSVTVSGCSVDLAEISIGDFARLGRVSVRMLRHYDTIGLLRAEHVDPNTGCRYYRPEQLRRLNRIVALKDLGLRLEQ
jgi:MerR HTH family regulatory protein